MLLFATFLPFFNFLLCSIFGRFLGRFGCTQIAVTNLFLGTFIFLVYTGTLSKTGNVCYLTVTSWIDCGLLYINWAFLYDSLSLSMLSMVVFISAFVHLYSSSYMESDPSYIRFLGYLSLFTFLMLVLLTSDNLIQLFFGWEGIGLASYLLISFWNTRVQANKAALKALLVNRIGDLGFLIATALIFFLFRSLEFSVIFPLAIFFESAQIVLFSTKWSFISLICFFLFIGSCGKSAQLGLHTWLPDAMEGPTPVSALIHAATLVTAGIYLVIRCSILFEMAPNTLTFITLIGASTAIFASSIGLFQYDLKKVIAYSTCSQLGYMCFTCGISQYHAAIFHLINHAFFKALLFLTAGVVIHALSGEQDMRRMGGLVAILPVTYNALLLGSLALMGFPFLSGFYSKDFILELSCSIHKFDSQAAFWLGSIAAYFTAFYSYRLLYLAFYSPSRSFFFYLRQVHELPPVMFFILNSFRTVSFADGWAIHCAVTRAHSSTHGHTYSGTHCIADCIAHWHAHWFTDGRSHCNAQRGFRLACARSRRRQVRRSALQPVLVRRSGHKWRVVLLRQRLCVKGRLLLRLRVLSVCLCWHVQ
jgi:proton-translocating NADH-quinone oxidoreductase chain L